MAITTVDGVLSALGNNSSRFIVDKAAAANTTAGGLYSLWRSLGQPGQGAIPSTPALCTKALAGAIAFDNQTAPAASYLGWAFLTNSNSTSNCEIGDRLVHNGGLVLNVTTLQTITGLDLSTLSVPAARLGSADYSDCQWFLEVYTDGGATASNATINVTYNDATTGNLNVVAVGGTLRAQRIIPLIPFIPTAQQGKYIRGINSVQLSASTTVAGNFGFTAIRQRTAFPLPIGNKTEVFDWAAMGFPDIVNDSCLMFYGVASGTNSGTLRGGGKIAHG